jgi:hypothetical protein
MRKHIWARAAILFVTISTLSGCIWWPHGDERGRGGGGKANIMKNIAAAMKAAVVNRDIM